MSNPASFSTLFPTPSKPKNLNNEFTQGYYEGWEACKKEILKVLKEDEITYYEACAQGTIEQIEKL